jgi:hypothetical protein
MSATVFLDDPAWGYDGGSCRLRVWEDLDDGFMLAVLHEDAHADGRSVANAMESVLYLLEEMYADSYGARPMVVQYTYDGIDGDEWHCVTEVNGAIRWEPTTLEAVADDLGVTPEEVLG